MDKVDIHINISMLTVLKEIGESDFFKKVSLDAIISVSAAIIALLIPIAILLIENNGNTKDNSFDWDKMVIFSEIIDARKTITALMLITIPLIFWEFEIAKLVIAFLYLLGIIMMGYFLRNCYNWIISKKIDGKNYRNIKRQNFLDKLEKEDQFDTWKVIWGTENQRLDMDELELLKKFIDQYRAADDDHRERLLSIYAPYCEINYENRSLISKFVYEEINRLFSNTGNLYTKMQFKRLYTRYLKQSINEEDLRYYFIKDFDVFFVQAKTEITRNLTQETGTEMINIIKYKVEQENTIDISSYIPKQLVYKGESGNKKQSENERDIIVFKMYFNWLRQLPINDSEKHIFNSFFASNLFNHMFPTMSASAFFKLNNFAMYISKRQFGNDPEFQDKVLLNYAKRTTGIIGMGRVHSFDDDEGSRSDEINIFKSINKKEEIATFRLFYDSDYPEHGFFSSSKEVEALIDIIKRVVQDIEKTNEKNEYNEYNIRRDTYIRLIDLKEILERYSKYIFHGKSK
ncbi:hypothetical protein D931_01708 [Enterococcus faecium 13.SD.W.09]|nr:hypothetical protein D931_01708 [Enterococcus faecium 13.SD.W.09]